jgi:DNA-binding response OmpR family regulator/predicted regulator of Ras-like GTPase activity (Roadblock/LC7/MglB family)
VRHQVLIVDPNEAFATMLRQSLDETGDYNAIAVESGRKALRAISSDSYDMVIVDLGLDDVDGTLLVRRLREDFPDMRLMVIPLFGEEPPDEITALNIQGILPKPFFLPELPELIGAAMNSSLVPVSRERIEDAGHDGKQKFIWDTEEDSVPQVSAPESTAPQEQEASGTFPWDIDLSSDPVQETSDAEEAPVEVPDVATAVQDAAPSPGSYSFDWSEELPFLHRQLARLLHEVNAQAVILVNGDRLISQVSSLPMDEVNALATIIQESWQTSARVAQILGKEQLRFEQSIEGDEHLLYSLALSKEVILSIIVEGHVPLGMIRHQSKETAEAVRRRLRITG